MEPFNFAFGTEVNNIFFYQIRLSYFLGNKFQLKERGSQSANNVWFIPFAVLFNVFFFLHGFITLSQDLMVTLTGAESHVFVQCCKFWQEPGFSGVSCQQITGSNTGSAYNRC